MEKRKNSLSALEICRFCLGNDESLSSIYDRNKKPKNNISLPLKILSCLNMEVFPSDQMPSFICQRCRFFMQLFYDFKDVCRDADERIMQYIRDGTSVKTINWPHSLTKLYQASLKLKPKVMKTITESGTTVQVTSQDISESEDEDEENVYNIKIGDDSEEGPKCIKVVTSKTEDSEKKKASKEVLYYEGDSEEDEQPVKARNERGKCWACDQCECTYALKQLLQLHKRQKHRARNVSCNQCNAKFFSKFDLMVHLVRHSDEMPFQCVACDKKFKRLVLLKRHEKTMHSDVPQLACSSCPATFLSLEELEVHQRRHIRPAERNHVCPVCNKRFLQKSTLRRHMEVVHPKKPAFPCEYCPARFHSATKLTQHLRSHVGERMFPCKFCDKSFLKSHHHTRHVRLMHRDAARARHAKGAPAEQFRCEQCDECFESQDELIYHSAIHATQNLTCPLCQEKFEDVDAVTAHIKSHVNGMEFMCDLCELVFTSKEKLNNHLTIAHAEELDHDESMEDMDAEEDDDDNGINVKEEDDHMVVEIKKPDGFMLPEAQINREEKGENTNSEESEVEATYTDLTTVDTLTLVRKEPASKLEQEPTTAPAVSTTTAVSASPAVKPAAVTAPVAASPAATLTKIAPKADGVDSIRDSPTASILRKAEEVKRKAQQITSDPGEKKEKIAKVESSNLGASDKSLRLLEKELQELKRTTTRNETPKPVRTMETLRNRRPQLHTSTPKTRADFDRKSQASVKSPAPEKKVVERKVLTKENKEPKEAKETKPNSAPAKEEKEKKDEKETPKSVVKNGTSDKTVTTPEETPRRSTRPSKIKDYAKMIRDKAQDSEEDSDDVDDDEYKEVEKTENKPKARRGSIKTAAPKPAPAAPATPGPPRKRGRPRKDQSANKDVPNKIKKDEEKEKEDDTDKQSEEEKEEPEASAEPEEPPVKDKVSESASVPAGNDANPSHSSEQKAPPSGGLLMSPTGQTLKKVPIRALPPGIKPLPLPVNARPMGPGELCEMQIGKKVVKVQKIVMTKAEVEAMAKKGLVEMKDGTMVLKQGIKLPTSDALSLKSTLVSDKDAGKESPSKTE